MFIAPNSDNQLILSAKDLIHILSQHRFLTQLSATLVCLREFQKKPDFRLITASTIHFIETSYYEYDFNKLIQTLSEISNELKEQSIRAVNSSLTLRNWVFGLYILEFEQKGKDRAEYGKALLASIAAELKNRSIPNTDERELRRFRQFYLAYPKAAQFFKIDPSIRGLPSPYSLKT